jgi:hypothetical protein
MSPEQARGEPSDARADLFSLGSVMYAMASGHPPFRAETTLAVLRRICDDAPRDLREANPDVPAWLAQIVHKLLAKRPGERYQSAAEVAEALERWLAHLQQPTVIPPPFVPAAARSGKSQGKTYLVGAIVAGLLAVAAVVVLGTGMLEPSAPHDLRNKSVEEGTAGSITPEDWPVESASVREKLLPVDAVQAELESLAQQTFRLESGMPGGRPAESAAFAAEVRQLDLEVQLLERELYGVAEPKRGDRNHEIHEIHENGRVESHR